ncbi:holin family protein [Halomonas sp. McH1-25]|uniref:3TM-type holin n=1 Tax=unclassified Halomonas TaxID=2609666 RepID=UPI001EF3FFFF|nr:MULTISPECIES: 3TM-type holin [unclassified Halomonas]MCG7598394.1 holin family protein [Halomonas sp. McH1-25]MCP1342664.1 holin family protein [Halomonas sp. FL8]MCP1362568.1 holin family protein [Halomonas sp. BBD45]MCP1363734.1 holin family protein [Halomonas sp. BBD48]
MNWGDIRNAVATVAPALGTALGGPAGTAVGSLLASALGVEATPEAVEAALKRDPASALKLRQVEADLERARMEATTERQRIVNQTMQAELSQEGWFKSGWRPALGWVFAASLGALAGVMAYTVALNPTVVSDPDFTGMLVWLFVTMGAALGINVRERSKDKATRLGIMPGSLLDRIKTR